MYIYQYYVVEDYHTDSYDGEIYDIHAGPFHSRHDANEWIYRRRVAIESDRGRVGVAGGWLDGGRMCVVRAKVEVRFAIPLIQHDNPGP